MYIGSAFPRLPRRFAPRNDNSGAISILTPPCSGRQQCAGPGCPLPAPHERLVPVAVTMVNAPDLSLRGPNGAVAISGRHCRFVPTAGQTHAPCRGGACPSRHCIDDRNKLPINTYQPIASVAAVTAQPLAALPPYGCGVPFTGSDRLAGWQCLQRKFIDAMPSSLSLRGGRRPTWQSRSTRPDHRKAIGENATAFPRLHPKGTSSRFALRALRRPLAASQ